MQGLTLFNLNLTHLLDAFLETAVPMIAGLAEVVGLFIIITSLAKATFYYVRATFLDRKSTRLNSSHPSSSRMPSSA